MRIISGLLALVALTSPGLAQIEIHETEQADFRVEVIASGLGNPWSMVFLPDGSLLVSEREGRLRLIDENGLRPEPVTGLPDDLLPVRQGGLLGLALHPGFAENRLVYFAYSGGSIRANHTALARGRLSTDRRSLEAVETLFRVNFDKARGLHFGGRVQFLADGTLLLTLGEGGLYPGEAQNLANHLGSIVRLNDDGTVPFDNPFVSVRGAGPEIYTYGHRNVQGIAINPQTGSVWANEHGARGGDEINIIEAGSNYGWPRITWGVDYDGTPISDATHGPGLEQPVWFWDPSIAPSGMSFYDSDAFERWRGDLFIGALAGQMLVRLEIDGDRVISTETLLDDRGNRIRDVTTGPDGNLYLLTDADDGAVLRLVPVIP